MNAVKQKSVVGICMLFCLLKVRPVAAGLSSMLLPAEGAATWAEHHECCQGTGRQTCPGSLRFGEASAHQLLMVFKKNPLILKHNLMKGTTFRPITQRSWSRTVVTCNGSGVGGIIWL